MTNKNIILRDILERYFEWNSYLYIMFIDFENAFDSVHWDTFWKNTTKIICLDNGNECAIVDIGVVHNTAYFLAFCSFYLLIGL